MGAGFELARHVRIHCDVHFALLCHCLVPLFFAVLDPLSELRAHDGSADVDDPLLRHLGQVGLVGEVVEDAGLVAGEVEDLGQGQVLVLRDVDGLDLVVLQVELLPITEILEEVNGHIIYRNKRIRYRCSAILP